MTYSYLLKFIIIGDSSVGKSCLLLQFIDHQYRDKHVPTIGVQFGAKIITIQSTNLKIQIWDTVYSFHQAGQQAFKGITRGYYRSSIGALIVYDITKSSYLISTQSFLHVTRWLDQAKLHSNENTFYILVGNKSDLESQQCNLSRRKVSKEQGQKMAKTYNLPFIEVSAKNNTNVYEAFYQVAAQIYDSICSNKLSATGGENGIREGPQLKVKKQKKKQNFVIDQQNPKIIDNSRCKC